MPKPQKGIKYYLQTERDRKEQERMEDDPMSPMFVPLTERSETGKARWWAKFGKKARDKKYYAEFD